MSFKNKTVVITGGGSGIGKATAKALHELGANIVINGRDGTKLEQAILEIGAGEQRIIGVAGDIGRVSVASDLIKTAEDRFGGVDILYNNAGIFAPKPFLDHSEEDFDRYLSTILKGSFFAAQEAAKAMKKRGGGVIINTGSIWAEQAVGATPSSAYSAAKAGVHALVRNLALELAGDNIRVNAIAPAVVETPVYETFLPADQVAQTLAGFNAFHPLGRIGQPGDVVSALLFLASDEAAWITGAILPVDGGVLAGR